VTYTVINKFTNNWPNEKIKNAKKYPLVLTTKYMQIKLCLYGVMKYSPHGTLSDRIFSNKVIWLYQLS